MVNKDFCLSSYMAFRYIWKDGVDFYKGFHHKNYCAIPDAERIPVKTSKDIDEQIQKQVDELYSRYGNIGILLCHDGSLVNLRLDAMHRSILGCHNDRRVLAVVVH